MMLLHNELSIWIFLTENESLALKLTYIYSSWYYRCPTSYNSGEATSNLKIKKKKKRAAPTHVTVDVSIFLSESPALGITIFTRIFILK